MNSMLEHPTELMYDDLTKSILQKEQSASSSVPLPALVESTDLSWSARVTGHTTSTTTKPAEGKGTSSAVKIPESIIHKSSDAATSRKCGVKFAEDVDTIATNTATVTTDDIHTNDTNIGFDRTFTSPIKIKDKDDNKSLTSSAAKAKFASKELRGNLTRRQLNRNPYTYYEVINILGLGSMGSVSMVRKRPSAIGGSARKKVTSSKDDEDENLKLQQEQVPCFQIPIIGPLVIWFHQTFLNSSSLDDINSGIDSDPSGDGIMKTVPSQDYLSYDNSQMSDDTELKYAMKSIHLSRCTDPSFIEELQNEISILKTLDHPYIEKVIETFEYEQQIFVILELCYGGDLYQRDPYTEDEAARITSSILSAISFMHSRNVYVYYHPFYSYQSLENAYLQNVYLFSIYIII
jgi:Protein kinase domain